MNFLCPACRTPLPKERPHAVVPCTACGVQVDLTRMDTAPGTAQLWPEVDLSGEALGPWKLGAQLGAGGMGAVYEAEGPAGRCAVKVLSAQLAADPGLRARFRREAAALRALAQDGIVQIHDDGEERGFCWYAMERVDGPDLRARIEKGALPADEVERLARRLLGTLAAVHSRGFVHRDLKPANVLLAEGGAKLCDFGIARLDGATTLTETAAVLGSLRYMAPEQRRGVAGPPADLYALGVTLHEALCGGVPGEKFLPKGTPPRLKRLVARLLMERIEDRPRDAAAALEILDARRISLRTALPAAALTLALAAMIAIGATRSPAGTPLAAIEKKGAEQKAEVPALMKGEKTQVDAPPQQTLAWDPAPQSVANNAEPAPVIEQQTDHPTTPTKQLKGKANDAKDFFGKESVGKADPLPLDTNSSAKRKTRIPEEFAPTKRTIGTKKVAPVGKPVGRSTSRN